jgi:hypothetical protein
MAQEKILSEKESLEVISTMIAKAKESYHDNGTGSILWGVIITLCSLVTWAEMQFGFSLPFDIWLLTLAAVIPTIILSIRDDRRRKVKSYDQTAMDYVWTCFGIAMFLIIFINSAANNAFISLKDTIEQAGLPRPEVRFADFSLAYMLVMYGIPTLVTAGIKDFKPMLLGGIICWVSAVLAVYTDLKTDMLMMAVSATMAWLVPGIILNRRSAVKKRMANV